MLRGRAEVLARERDRYVEFFEQAPEAYLVTDEHCTIEIANDAAGALLGVRCDLLVGKPLVAFLPLDERRAFRRRVPGLRHGAQRWHGQVFANRSTGSRKSVSVSVCPMQRVGSRPGYCWLLHETG